MRSGERYTHGHHESVLRSHRWRTVENSAAYVAEAFRPGVSVLDVGCGPGTISVDIAARVAPGRLVGIDLSERALAEARALAGREGAANAVFEAADVYALPFADGSFDVVHAHQTLQHLGDPVRALREMRRVCRPGGIVAARDGDYHAFTWYPPVPELEEWSELYQRTHRANGAEPDAGRHLLAWAHAAGFTQVAPSASVWCHATETERAWWGGMWADRIVQSDIADQALAQGFATPADLQRLSAGWRTWAADPDGWFTIVHGEIVCTA